MVVPRHTHAPLTPRLGTRGRKRRRAVRPRRPRQRTHAGAGAGPSGKGFACPAHGSRFRRNGSVERGPAQEPLERLPLRKDGRFVIVG